jgi:hypothetical protein
MSDELQALAHRLDVATGSDRELDGELARVLGGAAPGTVPADYTSSVDRCVELVRAAAPGWAWHVGWDASGLLPYATLHRGERCVEAAAPTVPLALLRALARALAGDER